MAFLLACQIKSKLNLSLYSLYCAEACNELSGAHFLTIAPGQHSSFPKYVAAVVSRWQHCVQFDRPGIWTSDLSLERRTCYRSINCQSSLSLYLLYNAGAWSNLQLFQYSGSKLVQAFQNQNLWHGSFFVKYPVMNGLWLPLLKSKNP